ncbi:MAG: sensor histidine kinase [Paraburkholderia sp.]|uniref:sensor histidine kinase n=1 Tax=Paraburkholderia sp. TaxID=1926495 RepID=UPI003C54C890
MRRSSEERDGAGKQQSGEIAFHGGQPFSKVQGTVRRRIHTQPELFIQVVRLRADYPLMFEALVNLVDNAIKFARQGGRVVIGVRQSPDGPRITVVDDGPGIPADERVAVLQRFYRSERTRDVPGSGLGLSVVQAVAHLHDFRLILADANPGTCVVLNCWRPPCGAVW